MTKMVTGYLESCFTRIILHALLNAANGERTSRAWPFLYQKNPPYFVCGPHPEIFHESMKGIVTDIDNSIFGTLAILDEEHSAFKINVAE